MIKDLEKMLMSKKGKDTLSEDEQNAKMEVLQELLQMAQQAMGSKVKGGMDELKKVSVMAPDDKSLAAGLDIAKQVAGTEPEETPEEETKEEASESPEETKMEALKDMSGADDESEEESDSMFAKKPAKKKSMFSLDDEE